MADNAPLKLIDIKDMLAEGARGLTPDSLAFYLGRNDVSPVPQGFDQRRLPFSDISPQLRDQRQASLAQPQGQSNPFSVFSAIDMLQSQANTPR